MAAEGSLVARQDVFRSESSEVYDSIKYGRCVHESAGILDMDSQQYVWVEEDKLKKDQLSDIIEQWGLESPNMIINITGPASLELIYKGSFRSPELQEFVSEAQACQHVANTGEWKDISPVQSSEELPDSIVAMLEEKVVERIVQMMVALLSACQQTNSWIVVNYDGACHTDWLLERALRRCQSRPVILAIIGCDWYKGQDAAWDILKNNARAIHPKAKASDMPVVHVPIDAPQSFDKKWPVGYATHYFFMHSTHTQVACSFPLSWLGPIGTMFVSGGNGCQGMMMESIERLEPTILLKHSGRAADFMAFAAEEVLSKNVSTSDQVLKGMAEKHPFFYSDCGEYIYGQTTKIEAARHASKMVDCFNAQPARFRTSVVVIDVWQSKPEETLRRLSACFASSTLGVSKLDLGGYEANASSIAMAKQLRETLGDNCAIFSRRSNQLTSLSIGLSVATTAIAIWITYVDTQIGQAEWADDYTHSLGWPITLKLIIVLPALAGLALQLLQRFSFVSKWSAMYMAKKQIEVEIFKFRTSVGDYDMSSPLKIGKQKDKNKDKDHSPKYSLSGGLRARDVFSKRVSDLYGHVLSNTMREDSMSFTSQDLAFAVHNIAGSTTWKDLAEPLMKKPANAEPSVAVVVASPPLAQKTLSRDDVERLYSLEDGCDDLSGEDYFEKRLIPLLEGYQRLAPKTAQRLRIYEIGLLVLSVLSTLLGALSMAVWIPIVLSLASGVAAFLQYEALQGRLAALNACIADLTAISSLWASLGVVEKRTKNLRTLMVDVTENTVLRIATAYVAGVAQAESVKNDTKGKDVNSGRNDSAKEGAATDKAA